jgi:hypothetical protein
MPPVEFEPTISVLERAKTIHALDRAATAIKRSFLLISFADSLVSCWAFVNVTANAQVITKVGMSSAVEQLLALEEGLNTM